MTTEPARTARPETLPESGEETETRPERLYHLILIDDDMHTYEYVIEMLASIFGYAAEKAWALARMVDEEGRVILLTGDHDECERYQQRIHSYGADPRIPQCQGSMTAVIEEAV